MIRLIIVIVRIIVRITLISLLWLSLCVIGIVTVIVIVVLCPRVGRPAGLGMKGSKLGLEVLVLRKPGWFRVRGLDDSTAEETG